MLQVIIWAVCFVSLYLSIFWISVLHFEEPSIRRKEKIKQYPFVSIIVPAFNAQTTIAKTLTSLKKASYPKGKLEIIVVNDG